MMTTVEQAPAALATIAMRAHTTSASQNTIQFKGSNVRGVAYLQLIWSRQYLGEAGQDLYIEIGGQDLVANILTGLK